MIIFVVCILYIWAYTMYILHIHNTIIQYVPFAPHISASRHHQKNAPKPNGTIDSLPECWFRVERLSHCNLLVQLFSIGSLLRQPHSDGLRPIQTWVTNHKPLKQKRKTNHGSIQKYFKLHVKAPDDRRSGICSSDFFMELTLCIAA